MYENNEVMMVSDLVQLVTLYNDIDTLRKWNSITENDSKCLQLNAVIYQ